MKWLSLVPWTQIAFFPPDLMTLAKRIGTKEWDEEVTRQENDLRAKFKEQIEKEKGRS